MIAILGRGKSLGRFSQFNDQFSKVYLVNPFRHEIDKLGRQRFKGKELVHVVSRGADCRLTKDQYELFHKTTTMGNSTFPYHGATSLFGFYYLNLKQMPEVMRQRGFPLVSWEDIELIIRLMPDITHEALIGQIEAGFSDVIKDNEERAKVSTRMWPTTGMFAIDLALQREEPTPEEIYLFGFDCFQNGTDEYYVGKQKSHQPKAAIAVMLYYLRKMVREFPNTTFRSADQLPPLENEPNWRFLEYRK